MSLRLTIEGDGEGGRVRMRLHPERRPKDEDVVCMRLSIVRHDGGDDRHGRCLAEVAAMDCDLMMYDDDDDDDDLIIVDQLVVPMGGPAGRPEVLAAMARVNALFATFLCPCGRYLVKEAGARECAFCVLTRKRPDEAVHPCIICMQESSESGLVRVACCGKMIHRVCLDKCLETRPSCPACTLPMPRAPGVKRHCTRGT